MNISRLTWCPVSQLAYRYRYCGVAWIIFWLSRVASLETAVEDPTIGGISK